MRSPLIALAGLAALQASTPAGVTGQLAGCHADAGARAAAEPGGGPPPVILPGFGDAGYEVERASPAARAQFDWGVQLNNAFNEPEAIRAFIAAQRADPACALCFWGEASARAPTINYGIDAGEAGRAVAALDRAQALAAGLSPKGRGIIAAERARYVKRGGGWAVDAAAYARAADALADRFAADDALQVAAADGHMIAGESRRGGPGADGAAARARLERVLARSPDFTPAMHLYIHLSEWQGQPVRAERYADRLGALAPAAGHLVHMPSHIYYRVGRFEDATTANVRAAAADRAYVAAAHPPGGVPALALHAHNLSFGLAAALMSGDAAAGLDLARRMQAQYPADSFVSIRAYLGLGRYLPADQVLALPPPAPAAARAYLRYARGEARTRQGDAAGVRAEAQAIGALQAQAGSNGLAKAPGDARAMIEVARLTLLGRASMLQHDWRAAADAYRRAARLREARDPGRDPPTWGWPPRRSLAAALLAAGDAKDAAREAKATLADWPGDGATLRVLGQAQAALHDPAAPQTLAAAARDWRGPAALLAPAML